MLDLNKRTGVIKSYSEVLMSLLKDLNEDDLSKVFFSFKENIVNEKSIQDLIINPCNVREYKIFLENIKTSVDINDNLNRFIYTLLKRRYLYLLPQILENTENLMKKNLSLCKLIVSSKNNLTEKIKQEIEYMVKKNSTAKNINIEYCIKDNLDKNSIELSSSGKVCVVNINNIVNEVLSI